MRLRNVKDALKSLVTNVAEIASKAITLTIIATIIDAPATVLNVCGDTASSMLVAKLIDGKNWVHKKNHPQKGLEK